MYSLKEKKIEELFNGSEEYFIPIYQRNYAWKETHINQLIQDIFDYAKSNSSKNYYIGTLVIYARKQGSIDRYETIDGQQRLTTLFILLCVLKNKYYNDSINLNMNLAFENRIISTHTLEAIYNDEIDNRTNIQDLNNSIVQAYENIQKALKRFNTKDLEIFKIFLLGKVTILHAPVPKDTDLNHYFEIMNNRGEQLEKHEVLKANLLNIFDESETKEKQTFHLIWEACSNMERYVQYGFELELRRKIFGSINLNGIKETWNNFTLMSFDEITSELELKKDNDAKSEECFTVQCLVHPEAKTISLNEDSEIDFSGHFTSPINFSNFLLQVLRVQIEANIPLDDKQLIESFEKYYKNKSTIEQKEFVKKFGFSLLKLKFLFDKYIIKREYTSSKDEWSLKKLQTTKNKNSLSGYYSHTFSESDNKSLVMLLSMFHVSAPTLTYKYWLNAALKYINGKEVIKSKEYILYLETLAKAYLFNRYLAKKPLDYFEIIYTNNSVLVHNEYCENLLDKGTDVENFVFNYLDYLLWKDDVKSYKDFEFTFRSSVEHYYPQNPIDDIPKLDNNVLNDFGNLCLISRSKNSRLSNFLPKAKTEFYEKNNIKDSIKQGIMMSESKSGDWGEDEIYRHGKEMKKILLQDVV